MPRRHAPRLFADGTLDPAWAPSLPLRVWKIAAAGNGIVYAAGDDAPQGNQKTLRIARIPATGKIDPAWISRTNGWLRVLAADGLDQVYVAGDFTHVNGVPRNGIARLSIATGDADPAWDAQVEGGIVAALTIDTGGRLYIGGTFSQVGGFARPRLARLGSDGALDPDRVAEATGPVFAVARDFRGDIYVGGQGPLARTLSPLDGGTVAGWHAELFPPTDGYWSHCVSSIVTDANGTVYIGGDFGVVDESRERTFARFSGQNGLLDAAWRPSIHGAIDATAVAADANRLHVGGTFEHAGGQSHQAIAAFETTLPDRLFAAGFESGWPLLHRRADGAWINAKGTDFEAIAETTSMLRGDVIRSFRASASCASVLAAT